MAQIAPDCKDTQDFQFKLHHKVVAFKKCGEPRSNVNLLAVSSSRGLLFAGSPTQPELKVIIVKDLVNAKSTGQQPQARLVTLPSIPNYIACNSDGNLLAVNYTQNGTGLLSIYAVISFMTPDVRPVSSIRLAAEDHVHSVQLLWNPVLPNSLAVVLSNGALAMYALKEGGHVEMHSLNKDQQVKCGCWSPKGKQIVLGFSGGTVKQFKPDLTLAKQILCPPNIHDAPFDTIAIQWLSTFQFAVIFLQHGEDCSPSLYILNAPKDGAPRYIKYYDICYSINGPRKDQFLFSHVPQWNLLLVVSANGVEVGIMGSTEAGDSPAWQQLTLLDEARIEMPLSEDKDETFPLGFAFDTSTTHQLTINEQKLQTMPMVHVLSSDGILLSFNFLNMLPTAVSVCSPPPPVADTSGQLKPLNTLLASEEEEQPAWAGSPPTKAPAVTPAASSDISFAFPPNTVTSTPAPSKDKQPSLFSGFGAAAAKAPASQLSFGTAPTSSPLSFGAPATNAAKPTTPFGASATNAATPTTPFGGFGTQATTTAMGSMFSASGANAFGGMALNKPAIASVTPRTAAPGSTAPATPSASAPANKPLYTVPSTFTPVDTKPDTSAPPSIADESLKPDDIEPIIKDMIALQIEAFSQDIQKQKEQTKELFKGIAAPSALRAYAKRLDDLQELNDQAKDVEFELDVQGLRQGLNEAYAIVAECRGKLEIYRKPEITRLMNSSSCDPSGRRMLARLQSYVAANEAQLRLAQQHVDMQWEQFQDVVRRNSKSRMHMPCLEGIYQRLTRLQNLTSNQRILQNNIKAKLKERGLLQAALLDQEKSRTRTNEAVDTLADSILKMSLSQVVDSNAAKLSRERLQKIRNVVQLQKINVICPQRPDRVGLKSEVILETKRRAEQIKKAAAKPATANKYTQSAVAPPPTPNVASTPAVAPMPQASVAVAPSLPKPMPSIPSLVAQPGVPTTPAATSFSFSQSSPFVNTSTVTPTTDTMTPGEAAKPGLSIFGGSTSSSFSFGGGAAKSTLSFGAGSPAVAAPTPKPNPLAAVEKPTPEPTKPKEQNAALELKAVQPETEESKVPQKPKAETENKSFGFGGFTGTADTAGNTSSSPFSFGGLGSSLGFGGTAAAVPKSEPSSTATTNVATSASTAPFGIFSAALAKPSNSEPITTVTSSTTTITSKPTNVIASSSSTDAPSATNNSAPIGGLFSSVNICKPNTPADNTKPANIFGGGSSAGSFSFGGTTDPSKGLFGSIKSVTSATTAPTSVTEANNKTDPISTTALTISTTTTTTAVSSPAVVSAAVTAAIPASSSTTVTSSTAVPGSAFSFSNAFSTLSAGGAVAPTTTAPPPLTANSPTSTSTGSNSSNSVFGGGFAAATSTAAPVANPFQSAAKSPVSSGNIFGSIPKPETSVFGGVATAPSNTTAAATPAAPPVGLFASAAISNPSPFGSPTTSAPASGVNIFGQAVKPSVFGQPAQAGDSGGSIFGGGSASTPFGSSSIFGGGNTQSAVGAPAAGSTSIFGQKVFGQSSAAAPAEGGNIFSNPVGSPQASPFGGGGNSIFGSPATASPASGGSIFGGGSSSGGFGSFTQTTPAQGGFGGGFGQSGGGSVAQTGFGSPQTAQQQTTTPGGFGGKPVFGGSPAFGASPTFGGGATFGSPKGFGGFGGASPVASPPPFGSAAKPAQGNIFETLGGQESGLSFGNLAQTGNSNAQKPAFGGSSFMNYR